MQKIILQFIYSFLLRNFLRLIVGIKFKVAKFLENEKQFIIVANHNSHLDTMTILASVPRKLIHRVKPVAAADHFAKTKLREKLSNFFVNTLLIQRKRDKENPSIDPINKMIRALDQGYSLIIFPEGTRGEPEIPQPMKPGIAYLLSQRPNIKYVPAFMVGMGKAMPKDDSLIIPHSSSLVYGKPAFVTGLDKLEILDEIQKSLDNLKLK